MKKNNTTFLNLNIWPKLRAAVRGCKQPCFVAVAYFGAGAHRLLPLPPGSRLVVNASEGVVASGGTCPADLIALQKRGVSIYSLNNIHAKAFVIGRSAYIGSANATQNSSNLIEALICTTDPDIVRAAREFVRENCLHELTPTVLKRLGKLYKPPIFPGGKPGKKKRPKTSKGPTRPDLPPLLLAQVKLIDWTESDQRLHDAGLGTAKKRRKHPRSFELESFIWTGKCDCKRDDVVIQVTNEGKGKILVTPPGNVLHVETRKDEKRQVSVVYLERPANQKRRSVKALAKHLGDGAAKRLRKSGLVRNASFSQALLRAWVSNNLVYLE